MNVDPKDSGTPAGVHQGDFVVVWNREPILHLQPVMRASGRSSARKITIDDYSSSVRSYGERLVFLSMDVKQPRVPRVGPHPKS